jgi:cytochrome P450
VSGYGTIIRERELNDIGPIVRISPYEIHVNDPNFLDILYTRSAPRDKWDFLTRQFGSDESTFSACHHSLHRIRRAAINPFFSKQRLLKLEGMIWNLVEKLCSRFEDHRVSREPLPTRLAYACLTTDVIMQYSMGQQSNALDDPNFNPLFTEAIKDIAAFSVIFKHVPWMYPILRSLPERLVAKLSPQMGAIFLFTGGVKKQIENIQQDSESDKEKYKVEGMPTIFHELLNSDLPPQEKTLDRLGQEAQLIVGAGLDTTAHALNTTTFHLLDNPEKLYKLRLELKEAMPDPKSRTSLLVLERLPYLSAVIMEGLRLSYGVSLRSQRIAYEPMRYGDYIIPPGVPVGMTTPMTHHDESIYPNSNEFIPERWIEGKTPDGRPLEHFFTTFGRGGRQCAGMPLAKAEIYLTLAAVFRRFDIELFNSSRFDVEMKHDLFLPYADYASKGVKVLVK